MTGKKLGESGEEGGENLGLGGAVIVEHKTEGYLVLGVEIC